MLLSRQQQEHAEARVSAGPSRSTTSIDQSQVFWGATGVSPVQNLDPMFWVKSA